MVERRLVSEVTQIYQLYQDYAAAMNVGDAAHWISYWMNDAIQMPPGTPRRIGREAIRKTMQPHRNAFRNRNVQFQIDEVQIQGDWAYCHGTYTIDLHSIGEGDASRTAGKFLDILRREADGSWKIAIDCHNIDT